MITNQLNLVSAQDVETYQRDGVVCLRQVFDQRWLDLVAGGVARNLAKPSAYAQNLKTDAQITTTAIALSIMGKTTLPCLAEFFTSSIGLLPGSLE